MSTVEAELQLPGPGGEAAIKLSCDGWELNVWADASDFSGLAAVREAKWDERGSLRIGHSAGAQVFWSCDDAGKVVTVMVGHDDEAWDFAVSVPVHVVDGLVEQLARA